jgi:hypothetical protein
MGGLVRADHTEQERLVQASERRLARFVFDLRAGPLQSVAALAEDVRLFRSRLPGVALDRDGQRVLGCVDDLEARLVALDDELRKLLGAHLRA